MSETKPSPYPVIRLPFGCTLVLLDFIAFVYVVTHWDEVTHQIVRLIELIP